MTDYEILKSILWDAKETEYEDQYIDDEEHDTPAPIYPALELASRKLIFTQDGKYIHTTKYY